MFGRKAGGLTKVELRIIANQVEIMTALATLPGVDPRVSRRLTDAMSSTQSFLAEQMATAPDR